MPWRKNEATNKEMKVLWNWELGQDPKLVKYSIFYRKSSQGKIRVLCKIFRSKLAQSAWGIVKKDSVLGGNNGEMWLERKGKIKSVEPHTTTATKLFQINLNAWKQLCLCFNAIYNICYSPAKHLLQMYQ